MAEEFNTEFKGARFTNVRNLAEMLTKGGIRWVEGEEETVALSVRMPVKLKRLLEQYSELGNMSQNLIARHLIELGLYDLAESLLLLKTEYEEYLAELSLQEESLQGSEEMRLADERGKAVRQDEALEALKFIKGVK